MSEKTVDLKEILEIFERHIDIADIYEAKCMGKISATITRYRLDNNMTQKEFAQFLGVSQGMVSRWEGGEYNFTIRGLAEIAEKLDMNLDISIKKHEESSVISCGHNEKYTYATTDNVKIIDFSSRVSKEKKYDIIECIEM